MDNIISYICVCISALIFSLGILLKVKKNILYVNILSSTFYASSYIFLGNKLGAVFAMWGILRLLAFSFLGENERYDTKTLNIISSSFFAVLYTVSAVFTWTDWFCILPVIGDILVSFVLGSKNVTVIKFVVLVQAILNTTYLFLLGSVVGGISQLFVSILTIVGIIRMFKKSENNDNNSNIISSKANA